MCSSPWYTRSLPAPKNGQEKARQMRDDASEQDHADYWRTETGQCPVCQYMATVIAGRISAHANVHTREACPGSGQAPTGEVLTRRERVHTRRYTT